MSVRVSPIAGWGFYDAHDGKLAAPFDIAIGESGAEFAPGVRGWKATALRGKYAGADVELTPRHKDWSGVAVISVYSNDKPRELLFSGMAQIANLVPDWE